MRKINRAIFIAVLIGVSGGYAFDAYSLPQGGTIVAGQGDVQQPSVNNMVVNQSSSQMIANWQGFSIGGAESVRFNQPNSSSVALNRVTGADPSSIMGSLTSNGQIFLTNPSGIIFGAGARVDVGGLIASTLRISDQDFLNRNYKFSQDSSASPGSIVNSGQIQSASYVGMLAPGVENAGTITANLGSVALASGKAATLDFSGDGLISFAITDAADAANAGVFNSGTIRVEGGQVTLSAKVAGDVISRVVNNSGLIEAKSVVNRDGRIFLVGGPTGEVVNEAGTLDVSAKEAGAKPGTVRLSGQYVGNSGKILARGADNSRGGDVYLESTRQTQFTSLGLLDVSGAGQNSPGGNVRVWSDTNTNYFGSIFARGGTSGDGGFVEVSGKDKLHFGGSADTTALNGKTGTLLLDPYDIIITPALSFSGSLDSTFSLLSGSVHFTFADTGQQTDTISHYALENFVSATTNIVLEASNDILFQDQAHSLTLPQTSGNSVTFLAGNNITFESSADELTTAGGSINLIAGNELRNIGKLNSNGGNITLRAGGGSMTLQNTITSGGGNISFLPLDLTVRSVAPATLSGVFFGQTAPFFQQVQGAFASARAPSNPNILIATDVNAGSGTVTIGQTQTQTRSLIGFDTITQAVTGSTLMLHNNPVPTITGGTVTKNILVEIQTDLSFIAAIAAAASAAASAASSGGTVAATTAAETAVASLITQTEQVLFQQALQSTFVTQFFQPVTLPGC